MTNYDTQHLERIEPDYLDQYGLNEAPFADSRDSRFVYLDAERAQRLNMLQHMTQYSNLLLMVIGERGIGKTTLMHRFIQQADESWTICQIDANTMMDAEHLLYEAARCFGLDSLPRSSAQLQDALYRHVADLQHQGKIPLLIIDDAHLLSKQALLAVFNLADTEVEQGSLMRIILFCDPDIEKVLKANDVKVLRERVTHTMTIPAFTEEVTAEYLKHRMAVAGFSGESPFTPKLVHKIYKGAEGVPAAINELAHMTLEQGDVADVPTLTSTVESPRASTRTRPAYIIWGSVGIILLALVLVFQDNINALFQEDQSPQTVVLKQELQSELKSPKNDGGGFKERVIPLQQETQAPTQSTEAATAPMPEPEPPAQQPAESGSAEAAPHAVSESASSPVPQVAETPEPQHTAPAAKPPTIAAISPNPVPGSHAAQPITITGEGFEPQSRLVVSWPGHEKTLPDSQIEFVSSEKMTMSITVGTQADAWKVWVVNPDGGQSRTASFSVAPPAPKPKEPAALRSQNWVLEQPPSHYTVQLFGTRQRSSAEHFVKEHRLSETSAIVRSRRNGADWFTVVMGSYDARGDAAAAAKHLPKSLANIKPWVRPFGDIQETVPNIPDAASATTPTTGSTGTAGTSLTDNEAWLWSQDPRHFTLQLLGGRSADSVKDFIREHHLGGKAVYFKTWRDGADWYAVVYGVYPDRQAAQQAIKRLPGSLRSGSPWVRSFASVHADLAKSP
jgi:septal ring-binding cell division protein DamX/type II secretory pathway predicted ATPase ExeA